MITDNPLGIKRKKITSGTTPVGASVQKREATHDSTLAGLRAADFMDEFNRLLVRHAVQIVTEKTKFGVKTTAHLIGTDVGLNLITLQGKATSNSLAHRRVGYFPTQIDPSTVEPAPFSPLAYNPDSLDAQEALTAEG